MAQYVSTNNPAIRHNKAGCSAATAGGARVRKLLQAEIEAHRTEYGHGEARCAAGCWGGFDAREAGTSRPPPEGKGGREIPDDRRCVTETGQDVWHIVRENPERWSADVTECGQTGIMPIQSTGQRRLCGHCRRIWEKGRQFG